MGLSLKVEQVWTGVSRTIAEDSVLAVYIRDAGVLTSRRFSIFSLCSFMILIIYFLMNVSAWPEYPILKPGAEDDPAFFERYPPFRDSEWDVYQLSSEIIAGRKPEEFSTKADYSPALSLLSAPLTSYLDERGPYFTNAIVLWICALVFFFIMFDIYSFKLAICSMLFVAFGTPNLFYAASAFPDPPSQLFILISVFSFWKGISTPSPSSKVWYFLAGLACSLNLFVIPLMAFVIILYFAILLKNGRTPSENYPEIAILAAGFITGASTGIFAYGSLPPFYGWSISPDLYGESLLTVLWLLIAASPKGLLALVPAAMLFPLGLILMWNSPYRILALLTASCVILGIFSNMIYWVGDGIAARGILAIAPLILIPLPFIWNRSKGERIWLASAVALTFYIGGFGWWDISASGRPVGIMSGDSYSSTIILARKGMLNHSVFKTSKQAADEYYRSLRTGNFRKWLQTIDPAVLSEFLGSEREIFRILSEIAHQPGIEPEKFIESADPDKGVKPALPVEIPQE